MTLEVGKFYKTRSGRKVRVYAVDGADDPNRGEQPVHGAVLREEGWVPEQWSTNGAFNLSENTARFDIVSEWTPYTHSEYKGENLADQ